ncbi:major facilitator superfamily protein [Klebsiella pneumoniae]|nr:major facilitator superfamily protein [Klebsiella pneumoniae]
MTQRVILRVRPPLLVSMAALFINGVLYATWGVSIPVIRSKFTVSEAELSLALAAVAMGGIVTMAGSSRIINRYGSRTSAMVSGVMMAFCASGIMLIPQYAPLVLLLILFGIFTAANDIALNTQVSALERHSGRSLIGMLHASFSAGGLTGSLLSGTWTHTGLGAEASFLVPSAIGALVILCTFRYMVPLSVEQSSENICDKMVASSNWSLKATRRRLKLFGLLAFSALVVEGAFYDWSAIYMREIVYAPAAWSGYGYASFSFGLIAGRFSGDWIRDRIAHQKVVGYGGALSLAGLIAVLINFSAPTVILGFLLTGMGISNIIPLLFSSSAKLAVNSGLSPSEGLAITTRFGYAGLLAGPLIVGPAAEAVGLRVALATLGVALFLTCTGWLLLSARTSGMPWRLVSKKKDSNDIADLPAGYHNR